MSVAADIFGPWEKNRWWQGPLAAVVMAALLLTINYTVINFPSPTAPFILVVVFAAWVGGIWSGLVAALVGAAASAILFSKPEALGTYTPDSFFRVIFVPICYVVTAVGIGILRNRVIERLSRPVRAREELFGAIMASLHDALLVTDFHGILDVNKAFCQMTGFTRGELLGAKPPYPFWPAEQYAAIAAALETTMRRQRGQGGGGSLDMELVLNRKNGERFSVLLTMSQLVGVGEQNGRVVYSFKDISDLKKTEESLRVSETRLKLAVQGAELVLWEVDLENHTVISGPELPALFGMPAEPWPNLDQYLAQIHPDDAPRVAEELRLAKAQPRNFDLEVRVATKTGAELYCTLQGMSVGDDAGKPNRILGLSQDITERKRGEQMLAAQRRILEMIATGLPLPVILDTLMETLAQQAPEMSCALILADWKTRKLSVWLAPHLPQGFIEQINDHTIDETVGTSGLAVVHGLRVVSPNLAVDPKWKTVANVAEEYGFRACVAEPIKGRKGGVIGTLTGYFHKPYEPGPREERLLEIASHLAAIAIERSQEEQHLRRSETELRLANQVKDRFLAVLSHELRTPLMPVLAIASALTSDTQLPVKFREDLELVRRNVESEARLIDDLLELTQLTRQKGPVHLEPVELRGLLSEVVEGLADLLRASHVQIIWQAGTELHAGGHGLPPALVAADARRLRQALRSLLRFAKNRAKPRRGGTGVLEIGLAEASVTDFGQPVWRISIRDYGVPVAARVVDSLFKLFSSEPPIPPGVPAEVDRDGFAGGGENERYLAVLEEGKTPEIGLALARAVVEAHAGRLNAETLAGTDSAPAGMLITVELPVAKVPVQEINQNMGTPAMLRILLVEDHQDTQLVLGNLLRRSGYHVLLAGSVQEAKDIISQGEVDLLISDIGLPDGSGMEVMAALRQRGSVPGIALSGYGTPEDVQKSKDAGFTVHIVKPVNVRVLEQAVLDVVVGPMGS